jgi:hypothetical protein
LKLNKLCEPPPAEDRITLEFVPCGISLGQISIKIEPRDVAVRLLRFGSVCAQGFNRLLLAWEIEDCTTKHMKKIQKLRSGNTTLRIIASRCVLM